MIAPSSTVPAVAQITPTQEPQVDPQALPCPFCGSAAEAELWHGGSPTKTMIRCSSVEFLIDPSATAETHAEALKLWNHRAPTPGRAAEPDTIEEVQRLAWNLRDAAQRQGEVVASGGSAGSYIEEAETSEAGLVSTVRTIFTENDRLRAENASLREGRAVTP